MSDKHKSFLGSFSENSRNLEYVMSIKEIIAEEELKSSFPPFLAFAITGNGVFYIVRNKKPYLFITEPKFNPILKPGNVTEAIKQLGFSGNYLVKPEDRDIIMDAWAQRQDGVARINLNMLNLEPWKAKPEYGEATLRIANYHDLMRTEKNLLEGVLGENMTEDTLTQRLNWIQTAKVNVLTPFYLMNKPGAQNGIARICWTRKYPDHLSISLLGGTLVNKDSIHMRGVPKNT